MAEEQGLAVLWIKKDSEKEYNKMKEKLKEIGFVETAEKAVSFCSISFYKSLSIKP